MLRRTTKSYREARIASAGVVSALFALACAQGSTDLGGEAAPVGIPDGSLNVFDSGSSGGDRDTSRDSGVDGGAGAHDAGLGTDANDSSTDSGDAGCTGHVVINEVRAEGTQNAADEFIELYNPTPCTVSVGAWEVATRRRTGTPKTVIYAFPAAAVIAANGFFLLGGVSFVGQKDGSYSVLLDATHDQIALLDNAANVVDAVGYGTYTAGVFVEGAPAISPAGGASISRKSPGMDTNSNVADFLPSASTPGAVNP